MSRKGAKRFFRATNAERVCAEIMLEQRDEIWPPWSEGLGLYKKCCCSAA
jgi:hypothetical protein